MHNNNNTRPPSDWQEVERFADEETNLVVKVVQDMAYKIPRYAIEIGQHIGRDDGYVGRRVPVFLDRERDEVSYRRNLVPVVEKLVAEAQSWIVSTARRLDDEYKKQREQDRINKRQPRQEVMRNGKTERKKARLRDAR